MNTYTVIALFPDYLQDMAEQAIVAIKADTMADAVSKARLDLTANYEAEDPSDFKVIAVFEGEPKLVGGACAM